MWIVQLVFVVAVVTFGSRPADACRCVQPGLASAYGYADAAFVGTITNVVEKHGDYTYTVAVEGVWKGSVSATAVLESGSGTGDCSRGKLAGAKRWLFLVKKHTTGFAIRLCGGTQLATAATVEQMTSRYGAPKSPTKAP